MVQLSVEIVDRPSYVTGRPSQNHGERAACPPTLPKGEGDQAPLSLWERAPVQSNKSVLNPQAINK